MAANQTRVTQHTTPGIVHTRSFGSVSGCGMGVTNIARQGRIPALSAAAVDILSRKEGLVWPATWRMSAQSEEQDHETETESLPVRAGDDEGAGCARGPGAEQRPRASLIELVKTRASQINGCAFCIHMHTRDARAHGEAEERLYLLDAWRESPLYTEREQAALAWTEAVTLVSQTHVPDVIYEQVRQHFAEDELVKLTLLVATINAWNRIAISFRSVHSVKAAHAAA